MDSRNKHEKYATSAHNRLQTQHLTDKQITKKK